MPATSATGLRPISIARRPLYALLLPVPIVCFIGNLLTDLAYINSTGNLLWLNFSTWLNAAGLLFAGITAVLLLIDTIRGGLRWGAFAFLVGAGLILSIIGVLLVLISGWLWQSIRYRDGEVQP